MKTSHVHIVLLHTIPRLFEMKFLPYSNQHSIYLVFLRRIRNHHAIFAEQLNCRYVFLDCLEREGIITEEERRNIMEADGDVPTRTYVDIPESCWPQMRDSEQMLMSNRKLLECLFEKNYRQISKFLKLMEDLGLVHILNYFISNEGSYSFFISDMLCSRLVQFRELL